MKRQSIRISIEQVHKLFLELQKEREEIKEKFRIDLPKDKEFIVSIINKTPECSDTWEFE